VSIQLYTSQLLLFKHYQSLQNIECQFCLNIFYINRIFVSIYRVVHNLPAFLSISSSFSIISYILSRNYLSSQHNVCIQNHLQTQYCSEIHTQKSKKLAIYIKLRECRYQTLGSLRIPAATHRECSRQDNKLHIVLFCRNLQVCALYF